MKTTEEQTTKSVEQNRTTKAKRRRGDRYDGRRVFSKDPFFVVIPHIMKTRNDSMVFFEENPQIEVIEGFLRNMRKEGNMPYLSMLHIIVAAVLRTFSQYPHLNRFVAGRRIYARDTFTCSMVVKQSLALDAEEMIIKPEFTMDATLAEVYQKFLDEVNHNKVEVHKAAQSDAKSIKKESNATEKMAQTLSKLPTFVLKFFIFLIQKLDDWGRLPKAIHKLSPFHASVFVTDIGSVGLNSIYHHVYNFGTCSIFLSLGKKERTLVLNAMGEPVYERSVGLRVVVDERICDGFYYAAAMKYLRSLLHNPERLLEKPENLPKDEGLPQEN